MTNKHVLGLDVARFVLACLVMPYHYLFWGPHDGDIPHAPEFHPAIWGQMGVEAFFMISGFAIMHTVDQRSPIQFAIARVVRLWPAIVVCASLTFLVTHTGHYGFTPTPWQWLKTVAFLPLAVGDAYRKIDGSYWSLQVEIWFYFIVFVAMILVQLRSHFLKILAIWMAASAVAGALGAQWLRILTLWPYSGCFIVGALSLAVWQKRGATRLLLGMLTLALLLTSAQMQSRYQHHAWVAPFIMWSGMASLAWLGARWRGLRWTKFATTLGAVSYPLYLLHQSVGYVLISLIWTRWSTAPFWVGACCVMLVVIASAWWVATFAEPLLRKPVRAGLEAMANSLGRMTPLWVWRFFSREQATQQALGPFSNGRLG